MTTWTRDMAQGLLGAIAAVDTRYAGLEPQQALDTADMWARLMNGSAVEPAFAMARVESHYRTETRKIMPGDIINPWRTRQQVAASREQVPALLGDLFGGRAPDGFAAFVAQSTEAWRTARQNPGGSRAWESARDALRDAHAAASLPWGRGVRVDDTRERRCVNHTTCICTHTECRDGWLDDDSTVPGWRAGAYRKSVRCPVCWEAVEMRGELTPRRKGRR